MSTYSPLSQTDSAEKVDDSVSTFLSDEMRIEKQSRSRAVRRLRMTLTYWPYFVHTVLFAASLTTFFLASLKSSQSLQACVAKTSYWSPGLKAVEYESLQFKGSLYYLSHWKGEPRPELDEAWHRVGQVGAMSLTSDEIRRLGKDPDYVIKWPEDLGGGHVASVETFHHLHCLNLLRKWSYREYYDDELSFNQPEANVRRHLDHCIDILRQGIMCHGDMGVMTYNWVKDNPDPYPDFDTNHRCRNFDKLLDWGERTMIRDVPVGALDVNNRMGIKILDG